jgi:hypothetical protein
LCHKHFIGITLGLFPKRVVSLPKELEKPKIEELYKLHDNSIDLIVQFPGSSTKNNIPG